MPNDAKLGLVVGVGLLIVIGVLFYRKELPASSPITTASATASAALPALPTPGTGRRHMVRPGETLAQLARQYYGDEAGRDTIQQANLAILRTPAEPKPGTVLIIPEPGRQK